jgi:hypothetical protein
MKSCLNWEKDNGWINAHGLRVNMCISRQKQTICKLVEKMEN